MPVYLTQVCIFMSILAQNHICVEGQDCPPLSFGPSCSMNCLCVDNKCNKTGFCIDGTKCVDGRFGKLCQYVDLSQTSAASSTPNFIRDNDDNTCNPDQTSTSVAIIMTSPVAFGYINIVMNDARFLRSFNIILNDDILCRNERKFATVNNFTVDVTCDYHFRLSKLVVQGAAAPYLCTVSISGGRNLAVKMPTELSSTAKPDHQFAAKNAVDGNTNPDAEANSCAMSNIEQGSPLLTLPLDYPGIVHSIVLYNRNINRHLLANVKIVADGQKDLNIYTYYTPNESLPVYNIYIYESVKTQYLKFSKIATPFSPVRQFAVCEIEVYADPMCFSDFQNGMFCDIECDCNDTEICNAITGACTVACKPGYYAHNCTLPCSIHCMEPMCAYLTGKCKTCKAGWTGPKCDKVCNAGTYGVNCSLSCSDRCNDTCHHELGNCTCITGFAGISCAECAAGFYGAGCNMSCSKYCKNTSCDRNTSRCTPCEPGRIGPTCSDCPVGYHGSSCADECNIYCANRTCDSNTGKCDTCEPGHSGDMCDDCPTNRYGPGCKHKCSVYCKDQICGVINGNCTPCTSGHVGVRCDECPPTKYGPKCTLLCSKQCLNKLCNAITGECFNCTTSVFKGRDCSDCIDTHYGTHCDKLCPVNCWKRLCNQVNGKCNKCSKGYKGDNCTDFTSCPATFWGPKCKKECPWKCAGGKCDQNKGTCIKCEKNYQGIRCDEVVLCNNNSFREKCDSPCPVNCWNKTCQRWSGKCFKCVGRYMGETCNICPDKYYGRRCDVRCPLHCMYQNCVQMTGHCYKCEAGYNGLKCEIKDDTFPYWLLVLMFLICALLVLFCAKRGNTVPGEERAIRSQTDITGVPYGHKYKMKHGKHKNIPSSSTIY